MVTDTQGGNGSPQPRSRRQSGDTIYSDQLLDLWEAEAGEAHRLLDDDCQSVMTCTTVGPNHDVHHHYPHRRSVKISRHYSNASPWRRKLGFFMESKPMEICVVILVMVDVVCVTAEVLHYLDVLVDKKINFKNQTFSGQVFKIIFDY